MGRGGRHGLRGLKWSELDAAAQAALIRQGYKPPSRPDAAPEKPAAVGPHGGVPGQARSKRSQTELDYEAWARARTSVLEVVVHPWSVKLPAERATYTPDMAVRYMGECARVDGTYHARTSTLLALDLVEVKGTDRKTGRPRFTEAGRLRAKLAAQALSVLGIRLVTAWRVKGEWHHETVPVRP